MVCGRCKLLNMRGRSELTRSFKAWVAGCILPSDDGPRGWPIRSSSEFRSAFGAVERPTSCGSAAFWAGMVRVERRAVRRWVRRCGRTLEVQPNVPRGIGRSQ